MYVHVKPFLIDWVWLVRVSA